MNTSAQKRNRLVRIAAVSAVLLAPVFAQWPRFSTAGVPKTADGKPDLSAPAPRAADGKPDLSGIWEFRNNAPRPVQTGASQGLGAPVAPENNQFWNIGAGVQGGLPFQPWAADLRRQRTAAENKDNPDAHCLPIGLMQLHTHPQPRKIIQTPGVIVILYEAQGGVRQIFTDGRPLPTNDAQPWWYGYSAGHWDGETLVVETNGFRDDVWLDVEGTPLTGTGKMTERFRRIAFGSLEIEVTIDDPKAYTKPWTTTIHQSILLDSDLIEFVCQENERDVPHLTATPAAPQSSTVPAVAGSTVQALDLNNALSLDALASKLADKRVVYIGEIHDRYDHHLNQLEMIRRLHAADPNLAIGVEYFQQPFQPQVDDYIAGKTTEEEFLRSTEYFARWGYDYRLYAPIFRFAREQHIPVRALNVPADVVSAVGKGGISSLSAQQRIYLPKELQPADDAYKSRLREAFAAHKDNKPGAFDHFVEAQLTWDEGMAQSAGAYLTANPGRRMVILAGSGHIMFGSGIPKRLDRNIHAPYAILLNSPDETQPHMADYILASKAQELPPAGVLGISLEEKDGSARIKTLTPGAAAAKAGLKRGDTIAEVDGQKVKDTADLRLILWQKLPGDHVRVTGKRGRMDVTLEAAPPRAN